MKAPAFQLYPQDFISSLDCQTMQPEEFGVYCWLLFHSWIQEPQCYLPNDPEKLSRLLRINPRTFSKIWRNSLEKKFKISECGNFLYNERLVSELEKKVRFSEKQAENGAKGGRPPKRQNPNETQNNPGLSSGFDLGKAKKSSSFSSSIIPPNPQNLGDEKGPFQEVFEKFRQQYPGTKRGLETEFEHFKKKAGKEWKEILPTLTEKLQSQKNGRAANKEAGKFVPEWKHLKTYLNNRSWEEVIEAPYTPEVPKMRAHPPGFDSRSLFGTLREEVA